MLKIARDGTNRGGRRPRTGPKPQSAVEKIQKGKEVKVMDIPNLEVHDLDAVDLPEGVILYGEDIPKPSEYLSAKQKDGRTLGADEIYKETYLWLKERKCEKFVNSRLVESYAQAFARYIQCEEAIST